MRRGPIHSDLIVIGMGGETYMITLKGMGGQPLQVLDDYVDFGPTTVEMARDMPPVKYIQMENLDETHALPVSFSTASSELMIQDVILEPGSRARVPLTFSPQSDGDWYGHVDVSAPNSTTERVHVTSFVGPLVVFPVSDEIFLAPTVPGVEVKANIPVVNRCVLGVGVSLFFLVSFGRRWRLSFALGAWLLKLTHTFSTFAVSLPGRRGFRSSCGSQVSRARLLRAH